MLSSANYLFLCEFLHWIRVRVTLQGVCIHLDVVPNCGTFLFFLFSEFYGACKCGFLFYNHTVRCRFWFLIILRCGAVPILVSENYTVRCGADFSF